LIFQPRLRALGGAEGVSAWIMQALAPDHALILVTAEPTDLAAIDRRYGTQLACASVDVVVHRSWPRLPLRLDCLRDWARQQRARAIPHDLAVAVDNEADLGERTVQYVHHPKHVFMPRGGRDLGWYHATTLLSALYFEASARATGYQVARMRRNRTLVCSDWIGARVRRAHGVEPVTLYPPAAGDFPAISWRDKSDDVVWAGRLWPDKRVELAIEIVERVRRVFPHVRLHLLASVHDPAYAEHIRSLVRVRPWIVLREEVDRRELSEIMAHHRYGLHAAAEEWFGMAPAELSVAGAVVFVPNGGGQVEIVEHEPRLVFTDAADAAHKLISTIGSPELQRSLLARLAARRADFSSARFTREFRSLCGLPPMA
jgi:glycosyltransferase involved in cell wall biosynthesis